VVLISLSEIVVLISLNEIVVLISPSEIVVLISQREIGGIYFTLKSQYFRGIYAINILLTIV
jgi:hypothetical protein